MIGDGFDEWGGYMQAKIIKLEEQFAANSNQFQKSTLFEGVSIFVNGRTVPTADELKRLMMTYGGIFHHYERAHTTFIIASNLPDVKVRNMNTSKIISPKWVLDCIQENRILDYSLYLLYTNQNISQPSLRFFKAEQLSHLNCGFKFKFKNRTESSPNELVGLEKHSQSKNSENEIQMLSSDSTVIGNSRSSKTAVDPSFLFEFFNNSRLHHIATLAAEFKEYITRLRREHDQTVGFPKRELLGQKFRQEGYQKVETNIENCVMHIDMDCFFVSVGIRRHPNLRGYPVAVTHSKAGSSSSEINNDRFSFSEIASCNYEARAKGIKNGMFVGEAIKLCPGLRTIEYNFAEYKEVAYALYNTVAQYTLNIEAVSCDEMFVDLTEVLTNLKTSPMDFVSALREEVRNKTNCPCSAGIGSNKLQARMATKQAKPDGQFYLEPANVERFMSHIAIEEIPGIGRTLSNNLLKANLITCEDLQPISLQKLQNLIGRKIGRNLYDFCRGIDFRPLIYEQVRKSVSVEVNYGIRFSKASELDKFLVRLCHEVHKRLVEINRRCKNIVLKLMVRAKNAPIEPIKFMGHGVCDNITKSISIKNFTNDLQVITKSVVTIMEALCIPVNELRGIGIHLTKLDDPKKYKEENPKNNILKNMFYDITKITDEEKIHCAQNSPHAFVFEKDSDIMKFSSFFQTKDDLMIACTSVTQTDLSNRKLLKGELLVDTLTNGQSTLNANKAHVLHNIQTETCSPFVCSLSNIFIQTNSKDLLFNWIISCDVLENYDLNLIIIYARELVKAKRLSIILDNVHYLFRLIKSYEKNCFWHSAFRAIIDAIQTEMKITYFGTELYFTDEIICNECNP